MKMLMPTLAVLLATLANPWSGYSQQTPFQRLPVQTFDVTPPSDRVLGEPGQMRVGSGECRNLSTEQTRRRIVDVAVQEWGFFGFRIVDETASEEPIRRSVDNDSAFDDRGFGRRFSRLDPVESLRVAASIGGYWAATPEGSWILERQNNAWNGPRGVASRWSDPWSAAFISWVMCEAGLGDNERFQRAIAHHTYIDQAIRARDGRAPSAAFAAYDIGEAPIAPGDLLCSGRRPAYRTLAERRRQMGVGARTHCDIVVKVDASEARIYAVGGNVRAAVSMKIWPATPTANAGLQPAIQGGRRLFAHLKLRSEPIEDNAIESSPTIQALGCVAGFTRPLHLAATIRIPLTSAGGRC